MTFIRARALFIMIVAGFFVASFATSTEAGTVTLTIVNIQTPQGAKVWVPESVFANKGDTVTLKLINKLDKEHGYQIDAFGIKEVVGPKSSKTFSSKTFSFRASKAGIFPIKCQLHKPHVAGQLVVLD